MATITIEEEQERLQKAILGVFSQGITTMISCEQLRHDLIEIVKNDLVKGNFVVSTEEIEKAITSLVQKMERGLVGVQPVMRMTKVEVRKPFPHPRGVSLETERVPAIELKFIFWDKVPLFKKTEGE